MGLPDLPEQTENEENFCMEQDNIINLEITSEDSDNESTEENEYMGYQPLSIHDLNEDSHDDSRVNEMTVDRSERSISSNVLYNNQEFLNLDVWNTPRPEALSIEIDQSKVAQIKDVMANFKLPVTSVPDWAIGVPEEQWKEDLLERIRQRQKPDIQNDEENSTAAVDKQLEPNLAIQAVARPKTPIYQRFTAALQSDPRCSQEVALGRRIGLYRFCGDIGRGNFSRVKLAVHQLTKDKVAIKVVDTSRLDAKALRMLSREVTTLESVFHPFILRLFEVIETLGKIHLISEWVQGGELYNRIAEEGPLEEYHAAVIFHQLLLAVKHLHNLGYVHRDIKAENVLMVSDDRVKLADFGFSTQLINGPWQHLDTFCGSPPYAAPELFSDDHYIGGPVDIWALGVLVYFMLHAKMPFKASTVPLLRTAVLRGEFEISSTLSLPCCRVIQRILVMAPSRRPTIEQLLKCQWFEYAETFKNVTNRKTDSSMNPKMLNEDDNTSEVPKTRRKYFWIFSTRGQRRQYSPAKSSSRRNNSAANQNETNEPSLRTIKCCTKRAGSVLEENFLHPIEIELSSTNHLKKSCFSNDNSNNNTYSQKDSNRNRRFSISRLVKKRISPLDFANKQENSDETSTGDFRDHLQRIIDEEHGKHVMYPTATLNIMHPLEHETRKILESLGITSEMIDKSVINGPRSDIIGIYRIMIHRLQREQTVFKNTNGGLNIDQKFDYQRKKGAHRSSSAVQGKDNWQEKGNNNHLTCAIL